MATTGRTKRKRDIAEAFRLLAPLAPYADAEAIREAAAAAHMKTLPVSTAVWLATVAHIRHAHSDYDALRDDGYGRDEALFFVRDDINRLLTTWRATRLLRDEDLS